MKKHKRKDSDVREFLGNWCPKELWELYDSEKINAKQFLLLMMVDSFNQNKRGCWMSNRKLAIKFHVTKEWIKKEISLLCKLGFLIRVGTKKRFGRNYRLLKTFWSNWTPPVGGKKSHPRGGEDSTPTPGVENYPPDNTNKTIQKRQTVGGSPTESMFPSTNGEYTAPSKYKFSSFDRRMAEKLWFGVNAANPKRKSKKSDINQWAEQFRLMRTEDGITSKKRIRRVLEWYILRHKEPYMNQALAGGSFRSKFSLIELKMEKAKAKQYTDEVPDSSQTLGWSEA